MSTTPTTSQQLHDLRCAIGAIANALGAALPHTPDVLATMNDLCTTVPPCKHCDEQLSEQGNGQHVHASGPQTGKGRCALEPYGFLAEPIGAPCSDHPANPCNGSRGFEPRQS